MIQCEKWQKPNEAKYAFMAEEANVIKNSISHMRSCINRLEQDFTKQESFNNPVSFDELVKLHNLLGLLFTNNCQLLEIVSLAENELSNYLNKYL